VGSTGHAWGCRLLDSPAWPGSSPDPPQDDGQTTRLVAAQQPISVMLSATSEIPPKKTTLGAFTKVNLIQKIAPCSYRDPAINSKFDTAERK
jgi:hypothetical protein